jgi:hypothetical protein
MHAAICFPLITHHHTSTLASRYDTRVHTHSPPSHAHALVQLHSNTKSFCVHLAAFNSNTQTLLCMRLQEKSYFALRLPAGWWVFGLDLALLGDIDMLQYRWVL